jgi:hypothetical protein
MNRSRRISFSTGEDNFIQPLTLIEKLLKMGIIRSSKSPYAAPVEGTRRFCVNYKKLNDLTVKDTYTMKQGLYDREDKWSNAIE